MSYPSRAPLLPGLPLMTAPGYPMPLVSAIPMVTPVMFAHHPPLQQHVPMPIRSLNKATQQQYTYSRRTKEPAGPAVTVFIGNITERAPDGMMRLIINSCGTVHNWKRVQGASGRLQAFGFCEFGNPDAALRSIRLLHDLEIADKRLVAKVDSKTQEVLDKYKDQKRNELNSSSNDIMVSSSKDGQDYMSEDMMADDGEALKRIRQLLEDYAQDMASYVPRTKRESRRRVDGLASETQDGVSPRAQQRLMDLSNSNMTMNPQPANLDDMEDVEEEKKDLISREIGLFRDKMKRQEEERERTRRERGGGDRDGGRGHRGGSRSRSRERSVASSTGRRGSSRSRSPSELRRSGSPPTSNTAGMSRSKHNGAADPRFVYKSTRHRGSSREPDRPSQRRTEAEILRQREEEEEARERKKLERKARDKEAAYQERLRAWETREAKRQKDVTKEQEREKQHDQDAVREAKKLKEFLEDYDDEKDDPKYYKGRELQRRLAARAVEGEEDARDLQKEKEELEELRTKVQEEGHKNPLMEFERLRKEREAQYKPRLLVKPDRPRVPPSNHHNNSSSGVSAMRPQLPAAPPSRAAVRQQLRAPPSHEVLTIDEDNSNSPPLQVTGFSAAPPPQQQLPTRQLQRPPAVAAAAAPSSSAFPAASAAAEVINMGSPVSSRGGGSVSNTPVDSYTPGGNDSSPSRDASAFESPAPLSAPSAPAYGGKHQTKKKLNVRDVFNTEEDEEDQRSKKRKLVPIDHDDDSKRKEDKKRMVKKLIEKIPTGKDELFSYSVDWDAVDNTLMERRMRPWISKKIAEYIGEPEPTLVEFICSKILVGSTPQAILDDVQMVLDEEADVFVVKMWRLLIYEIEAKKYGLGK